MIKKYRLCLGIMMAVFYLAGTLILSYPVYAAEHDSAQDVDMESILDDGDDISVEEGDQPYIALGADLTDDELATVLSLMGTDAGQLSGYDVTYITNEQEHEFLDPYLDRDITGSRALSSVLVMEGEPGSGINVDVKNITYCTEGMYENALATAGFDDVEVIVAAPFPISGTAALIGAVNAYSDMTGNEVGTEVIDGAIDEMVTTGKLEEEIADGSDTSVTEIEGMIADLKQQAAEGNLSEEELDALVEDTADRYGITLTPEQSEQLTALLDKLQGLDLNLSVLSQQAGEILDILESEGWTPEDTEGIIQAMKNVADGFLSFLESLFAAVTERFQ